MMEKTKIRYATAHDAEMLAELAQKTFWEAYYTESKLEQKHISEYIATAFSVKQIKVELQAESNVFLMVETDSEEIGYAKLAIGNTRPDVSGNNPMELCRIYFRKEFWGKHLGTKLLDRCFREAKSHGCDKIWLSVWQHNEKAIRFYERCGFAIIGTHIFLLASSPQTDYIMERNLG